MVQRARARADELFEAVERAREFGEEFPAQSGIALADALPGSATFAFTAAVGGLATRTCTRTGDRFFTRTLGDEAWRQTGTVGLGQYSRSLGFFAVGPGRPERAFSGMATPGRSGIPVKSIVQQTTDGGVTWTNDMPTVFGAFGAGKLMDLLSPMPVGHRSRLWVDLRSPQTLYAVNGNRGILKSTGGGTSWSVREAGLLLWRDRGETWENGHLVLQFTRNRRRELGGAAFIDAYWRSRCRGFIDDETARSSPADGVE